MSHAEVLEKSVGTLENFADPVVSAEVSGKALDDAVAQTTALQNQMATAKARLALAERNVGKTNGHL